MIKLVALDLDDTVLGPDRSISDRVKRAIKLVQERGARVVLVTGRMFCAAAPFAVALGLPGPLVAYQGSLVKSLAPRSVWRHLQIPPSRLQELLLWLEREPVHINLYIDDALHVAALNDEARRYAEYSQVEVKAVGRLSTFAAKAATKVVAIGEPSHFDDMEARARDLFGADLAVNRSYDHFLEFGHQGATKSQALAWLGEKWGIKPRAMLAIGDGANDLDMIEYAGIGVAMANGAPVVQRAADFVTASNREDGVALALEKYFKL